MRENTTIRTMSKMEGWSDPSEDGGDDGGESVGGEGANPGGGGG